MAIKTPLRYINDGEPLDENTLNRSNLDIEDNLEELFSRVDGYDEGTSDAISDRVVLRNNTATAKFGVPSDDQHPFRLNEFREFKHQFFEESDRSNTDPNLKMNYDHLPLASGTEPGITQLIDSYTGNDTDNAPTANAIGDFYRWLISGGLVDTSRLPESGIGVPGIVELVNSCNSTSTTKAPTAKSLKDCIESIENTLQSQINNLSSDISSVADSADSSEIEGAYEPGSNTPSGNRGEGWVRFSNGFIIQFGSGRTGSKGITTIVYPVSFTTNYSIVINEANSAGWDLTSLSEDVFVEPTVYGTNYSSDSTTNGSAEVWGGRIPYYASQPGPYLSNGMDFQWVAFGL